MRFTVYFPCTCLYAFHCQLCACLFAVHCLLSLRMPLRTSLRTCPARASVHLTDQSARLCAVHCLLSLCLRLRTSLCSLSTFPAQASMHFTAYFPCACICALHSVLALRMPLRTSLSTSPVRAAMHSTVSTAHVSVQFTVYFPCACVYALHSVLVRAPLCSSLSTFPAHVSMCITLHLPHACLYAFYCAISLRMPLHISRSTFRLCSRSCGDVLRVLLLYLKVWDFAAGAAGTCFTYYFVLQRCDFAA